MKTTKESPAKSTGTGSKSSTQKSKTTSSKTSSSRSSNSGNTDSKGQLTELYQAQLKDIYWAEKALVKALPKMAKNATSPELTSAIETHLEETRQQVTRVESVFEVSGFKAQAKTCEAMKGLLEEAEEMMEEFGKGVLGDAAIIAAAQKVEHYEIATYGTLQAWASALGMQEAAELLEEILGEEKNADMTLTEIAREHINSEALQGQAEM